MFLESHLLISLKIRFIPFFFLFSYFKNYSNEEQPTFGNLLLPPDSFYSYINKLYSIFIANFPILAIENNVGKRF